MSTVTASQEARRPYPGLRPFRKDEADLFFGRDQQVDQMLERLARSRFLAVVGESGCGKSSLVRAGLIVALETGIVGGEHWRVATMTPGREPMGSLARALLSPEARLGAGRPGSPEQVERLAGDLRRGSVNLAEILRDSAVPKGTNLLLVVDQFEEVIHAREKAARRTEFDAFVALLLEAIRDRAPAPIPPEVPQAEGRGQVYVVLTMRSDYLGACSIFSGLPEALNDSQFLTPRLTRAQRREAIEGPAAVCGGEVDLALVVRLLNDTSTEWDMLPLMQHALMRLWMQSSPDEGTGGEPGPDRDDTGDPPRILTADTYEGLAETLNRSADEAFDGLDEDQKAIAETMFRCLCERNLEGRERRQQIKLEDIARVAGVEDGMDRLFAVVEAFRHPDRNFLVAKPEGPLGPETLLDITHESLIRQWEKLKTWIKEEEKAAERYRRFRQSALWHSSREAGLLDKLELDVALEWSAKFGSNPAWAARYDGGLELVMDFIRASEGDARRRLMKIRGGLAALLLAAASVGALLLWEVWATRQSTIARGIAETKTNQAETRLHRVGRTLLRRDMAEAMKQGTVDLAALLSVEYLKNHPGNDVAEMKSAESLLHESLSKIGGEVIGGHLEGIWGFGIEDGPAPHWLSAITGPDVHLWDIRATNGRNPSRTLHGHSAVLSTYIISNSQVACLHVDGSVAVWDLRKPDSEDLRKPDSDLNPIRLSGAPFVHEPRVFTTLGHWLVLFATGVQGESPVTVFAWDLKDLKADARRVLALGRQVNCSWSSDRERSRLAVMLDGVGAFVCDFSGDEPRQEELGRAEIPDGVATVNAFSAKDRLVVTFSNATVRVWNLDTPGAAPRSDDLLGSGVTAGSFITDYSGRWAITGDTKPGLRLWDLGQDVPSARSLSLPNFPATPRWIMPNPKDERWLAVAIDNGLCLVDLGAPGGSVGSFPITVHEKGITTYVFSPDGRWLFTGGADGTIVAWDLGSFVPKPFFLYGHEKAISILASDGTFLYSGSADGTVRRWRLGQFAFDPSAEPAVVRGLNPDGIPNPTSSIVVTRDRRRMAVADLGGGVRLFDLTGVDPVASPRDLSRSEAKVRRLALSADDRWLVGYGGEGDPALFWDLHDDRAARPLIVRGLGGTVQDVRTSADGLWAAIGVNEHIPDSRTFIPFRLVVKLAKLVPGSSGTEARPLSEAGDRYVGFSAGGRRLVTSTFDSVQLRDLTAPDPFAIRPRRLSYHEEEGDNRQGVVALRIVALGRDGRWLATSLAGSPAVTLWDLEARDPAASPIHLPPGEHAAELALFSPDGRWLYASDSGGLSRWDLGRVGDKTAALRRIPNPDGPCDPSRNAPKTIFTTSLSGCRISINREGRWIARSRPNGAVHLWDLNADEPEGVLVAPVSEGGAVPQARFSPDGRRLIVVGRDNPLVLWDLETSRPVAHHYVLRPEGSTGSSSASPSTPDFFRVTLGDANPFEVSDDRRWLAVTSGRQTRLWELVDGKESWPVVLTSGEESIGITNTLLTPGAKRLVTLGFDGSARFWTLGRDDLIEKRARRIVGRNLTRKEFETYLPGEDYHKTFRDPNLSVPTDEESRAPGR
jgi:WD40 repeat protein